MDDLSGRPTRAVDGDLSDSRECTRTVTAMEPVYASVIAFARGVFAAEGLKFDIQGAEHVPAEGGAVLVSNHLSYLDFAYAGLTTLPKHRRVRWMAKEEVFRHRISGPLMRAMRHIPVDRAAGAGSFRAAVGALKSGEIVGVFPEATISRSLEPKLFKTGAVRMAAAAGVPILPMAIWGSQRIWTKDHPKRLGRSAVPIVMIVGEPIEVARRADFEATNAVVQAAVTRLLHRAQEGYPALTGPDLVFVPARLGGSAPTPEDAHERDEMDARGRT
jgi:1-acyl-sn-glycerol-3-phosphate acyltransferase